MEGENVRNSSSLLITVAEWNIRGENSKSCQTYVADRLAELKFNYNGKVIKKPDIIILTEYVENKNYDSEIEKKLAGYGYCLFRQPADIKGNAILIAIKNKPNFILDTSKRVYVLPKNDIKLPNFMGVFFEIKLGSMLYPITVIGYRTVEDHDYGNRSKQLDIVFEYLRGLDSKFYQNIIFAGDFNNGIIRGDENDLEHRYSKSNAKKYNYQLIKKIFKKEEYNIINTTPIGNDKYSFCNRYTYKLDHIFVKGFECKFIDYDWNWKDKNNIQDTYPNGKIKGYNPDHAILQAVLEFTNLLSNDED